ncbi:MAG: tetratricopeptide repeat protein, partial [Flavobacteriales bacterium]|nr:tetratricopeptide repeat protein [Flavobacteriales bacterium]
MRYIAILAIAILGSCGEKVKEAEVSGASVMTPELRALDSISTLIDRSPGNTDLLNARAKMLIAQGNIDYALTDIGRALLMDSTKADYYLTIADIYFQRNEPKRCLRALEKARTLDARNLDALYRLAQFNLYIEKHQQCIDLANEMLKVDAQDDRPFFIKALAFRDMKDTARAIENYLLAAEQNPDNFDVQMDLGVLHYGKKSPMAESFLRNALTIRPDDAGVLYALGMAYQQAGKAEEAIETYTRLTELDSTHGNAFYNLGYVHFTALEDYVKALEFFQKATQVAPNY